MLVCALLHVSKCTCNPCINIQYNMQITVGMAMCMKRMSARSCLFCFFAVCHPYIDVQCFCVTCIIACRLLLLIGTHV